MIKIPPKNGQVLTWSSTTTAWIASSPMTFETMEPPVEHLSFIISAMKENCRDYVVDYMKHFHKYDNLREAFKKEYPEGEIILDKLLILK